MSEIRPSGPVRSSGTRRAKRPKSPWLEDYAQLRDARDARRSEIFDAIRPASTPSPDRSLKVSNDPAILQAATPSEDSSRTFRGDYDTYINSKVWQARKKRYFKTHPRRCRFCRRGVPSNDQIHLHHLSYERMGDELDSDLMPLCPEHHDVVHQHHRRVGGDLRAATWASVYIAESTVAVNGRPRPHQPNA